VICLFGYLPTGDCLFGDLFIWLSADWRLPIEDCLFGDLFIWLSAD
jgi:hypothetical protein